LKTESAEAEADVDVEMSDFGLLQTHYDATPLQVPMLYKPLNPITVTNVLISKSYFLKKLNESDLEWGTKRSPLPYAPAFLASLDLWRAL
jgi:hypothetical protein